LDEEATAETFAGIEAKARDTLTTLVRSKESRAALFTWIKENVLNRAEWVKEELLPSIHEQFDESVRSIGIRLTAVNFRTQLFNRLTYLIQGDILEQAKADIDHYLLQQVAAMEEVVVPFAETDAEVHGHDATYALVADPINNTLAIGKLVDDKLERVTQDVAGHWAFEV
jgi:hypothetical protein